MYLRDNSFEIILSSYSAIELNRPTFLSLTVKSEFQVMLTRTKVIHVEDSRKVRSIFSVSKLFYPYSKPFCSVN